MKTTFGQSHRQVGWYSWAPCTSSDQQLLSMTLSMSCVSWSPLCFKESTKVFLGLPLLACPCRGSHSTAGCKVSCGSHWAWPARLSLLLLTFELTFGRLLHSSDFVIFNLNQLILRAILSFLMQLSSTIWVMFLVSAQVSDQYSTVAVKSQIHTDFQLWHAAQALLVLSSTSCPVLLILAPKYEKSWLAANAHNALWIRDVFHQMFRLTLVHL